MNAPTAAVPARRRLAYGSLPTLQYLTLIMGAEGVSGLARSWLDAMREELRKNGPESVALARMFERWDLEWVREAKACARCRQLGYAAPRLAVCADCRSGELVGELVSIARVAGGAP